MCGFVGFTGAVENKAEVIESMMNRIAHRGPDMGDHYIDDQVTLGFRRLSILDLSAAGSQPMSNEDGSVVIVFNGEVYNFQELRSELEAKGYRFSSHTDTESLLHGYEEWGEDLVGRLRGMYAFVVWDKRRGRLFGARDIFGIKPFYWCRTSDGNLLFGSEIKSFLDFPGFHKAVNRKALRPYLSLQYSGTNETFFEGVYKLEPAHYFTYDIATGSMDIKRYWECDFTEGNATFDEYVDEVNDVMHESVDAHRIADVEVGSFLSGGVDSSYIAACLHPDETFSVGFDFNKFNETNYAAELSEKIGTKNFRKMVSAEEFFDVLPTIQYHMDEPQSDLSSVPLYFLAQMAAEHVTVVLSGEGADELFAGYAWYEDNDAVKRYKHMVPRPIRRGLGHLAKHMPYFKGHNFLMKGAEMAEEYFVGQALIWPEREVDAVLRPEYDQGDGAFELAAPIYAQVPNKSEVTRKQYLDMHLWLPGNILLKADKMCMAHSLELRVPFLDKRVMEVAEHIPTKFRVTDDGCKLALRAAANKVLPDAWASRKKVGFPVPMIYWLREQKWYDYVKAYFTAPWAGEFFDCDLLMRLLDDHFAGHAQNQRKIYTALTFLIWYKRFFIDEEEKAAA